MNHHPYKFDRHSRIKRAMEISAAYSQIDGAHHKDWANDQIVRALTGCPIETKEAVDCNGVRYTYEYQGESDEYKQFVKNYCTEDGDPDAYSWSVGGPP